MHEPHAGRVIVGIDESVAALRALRIAVAEARRRGAELHAVRAWTGSALSYGLGVAYLQPDPAKLAADTVADAFQAAMGGRPADVRLVVALRQGDPATALVTYAERDEDLLVVGASRRWWSTSRACARRAQCPVLIVPPARFARHMRRSVRRIRHDVTALERAGTEAGVASR